MPLNFSDTLSTGEGSFFSLMDLTENRVKGVGFYASLLDVFDQPVNQRCLGFLAIVADGENPSTAYQFVGGDLSLWADSNSWQLISSAPDTTSNPSDTQTASLRLSQSFSLIGSYDSASSAPDKIDLTEAWELAEMRFDSPSSQVYALNDRGFNVLRPSHARHWDQGPFAGYSGDTIVKSCFVLPRVKWGYEHYLPVESEPGIGFNGFTEAEISSWTGPLNPNSSFPRWAGTGGNAADEKARNFLLSIPAAQRARTNVVFFPVVDDASYSLGTVYWKDVDATSDADIVDPTNWILVIPYVTRFPTQFFAAKVVGGVCERVIPFGNVPWWPHPSQRRPWLLDDPTSGLAAENWDVAYPNGGAINLTNGTGASNPGIGSMPNDIDGAEVGGAMITTLDDLKDLRFFARQYIGFPGDGGDPLGNSNFRYWLNQNPDRWLSPQHAMTLELDIMVQV